MAEEFFVQSLSGQAIVKDDINLMASVGGLADDHVLAEILRLAPFGGAGAVAKAILPFGHQSSGPMPTVSPAGASGSLTVAPFRAVVGSRDTLANIGPKAVWNDLRSAIFTGVAQGTLTANLQLAANGTQTPRWDLVVAALKIDADGQTLQRYRKDPATEQVTLATVVRTKVQLLTLVVVPGAPSATPQKPALPADANGTYFFPLAYVRVPAGFNATSTVLPGDIDEVIPYVPLARVTGASTVEPANQQYLEGGTVLSAPGFGWTPTPGLRPGPFIPPTMAGAETLLVAMDLSNANAALWSHVSSSVVDSRDWRFRVWDWRIFVRGATAGAAFAWRETTAPSLVPQAMTGGLAARAVGFGMGQSFVPDGAQISAGAAVVLAVDPTSLAELGAASRISLYVDHQDGGKLKFSAIGAPNVLAFIWLTASAPYPNV